MVRLDFDYNVRTHVARVHVTNHGPAAVLRAPLHVEGELSAPLLQRVFAVWEHSEDAAARLDTGETRTLRVARLETAVFPYAQWILYLTTASGGLIEAPALHVSAIGGLPDTQAPAMTLRVGIAKSAAPDASAPSCVIRLQPFSAELH